MGFKLAAGAGRRRGCSSHGFAPRWSRLALARVAWRSRETSTWQKHVWDRPPAAGAMDPTAVVRAIETLMSPLEWGSQDAWLAESLKRVRHALGRQESSAAEPTDELEALLRVDGDQPGWLQTALDSAVGPRSSGALSPFAPISEDCLPLVSMRCALTSGLAMLHRMREWRSTLGQLCDDMNAGLAIFRCDGLREVARNTRWSELVDEEPERVRLLELIRRRLEYTGASAGSPREDYWELKLSGRSYRVTAKCAPAGTLLAEAGVLVLMDRLGPELPTTRELRVSFGLQGREPQVALLAAEGLSNEAIAQRLRLSAHTVRHYLERVLTRLGLHSRKALALHLIAGQREKPPAEEDPAAARFR
jgi:DNA-binding CsgD family transcriptional regulator